jgi:7-cyano-7-deazaguanine synthase
MKLLSLLSAGLDSTVNTFVAAREHALVGTLSFDYGQRAAPAEIRQAKQISNHLGVHHTLIDLPWFKNLGKSSLNNSLFEVPTHEQVSIDDLTVSQKTAERVWVPNRNGVFLNIAAALAEAQGADGVVVGFNVEEAATFPDNSQEYLDSCSRAFAYSTRNGVKAVCFTTAFDKTQIVARGIELGVQFELIWPCYFNGETWCGACESCQRSLRALRANGITRK